MNPKPEFYARERHRIHAQLDVLLLIGRFDPTWYSKVPHYRWVDAQPPEPEAPSAP